MKYLVTGGCGFIGSNYIKRLLKKSPDAEVVNVDCLTYAGRPENVQEVANDSRYMFYKANIQNAEMIEEIFRLEGPIDYVINFAAFSHVDRSILEASEFVMTNVVGTFNLLEACRKFGFVRKFIQINTDEVYGQIPAPESSVEKDMLDPRSPYSSTKASSGLLALSYYTTHKVPVIVTRCVNNYGSNQLPEKLIPLFVTNLIDGEKVPVYGDGLQVREWIHVEDHNDAVDFVIECGNPGEIYNIGSGEERTNLEITELILNTLGRDKTFIKYVEDRKGHDRRYSINCNKIKQLGWVPKRQFEEAMMETINWYVENQWWWKPIKKDLQEYYKRQY